MHALSNSQRVGGGGGGNKTRTQKLESFQYIRNDGGLERCEHQRGAWPGLPCRQDAQTTMARMGSACVATLLCLAVPGKIIYRERMTKQNACFRLPRRYPSLPPSDSQSPLIPLGGPNTGPPLSKFLCKFYFPQPSTCWAALGVPHPPLGRPPRAAAEGKPSAGQGGGGRLPWIRPATAAARWPPIGRDAGGRLGRREAGARAAAAGGDREARAARAARRESGCSSPGSRQRRPFAVRASGED